MRMGTNCEIGTTAKSLIKELKKYGFLGHLKTHASVKELETHLKNGSFPILHVQSDGESHWVVLIDIDKKYLTVMDPWKASSYRKVTRLGLNQIWYGEEGHNAAILW